MTVLVVILACVAGGAVIALIAVVGSHSSRAADRYRNDSGGTGGHWSGSSGDTWDSGHHHGNNSCGSGNSCSSASSCSSSSCGSGCGGGGGGD